MQRQEGDPLEADHDDLEHNTPHMLAQPNPEAAGPGTSVTWMTRTRVSGYFLNTDSNANAGKRRMVARVAARASTVLYGDG